MSKFHINKHGVPAPCRATKGNCPLGGSESHFETEAEAQAEADRRGALAFSVLPTKSNTIPEVEINEEEFDNFKHQFLDEADLDDGEDFEPRNYNGVVDIEDEDDFFNEGEEFAYETLKNMPEDAREYFKESEDGVILTDRKGLNELFNELYEQRGLNAWQYKHYDATRSELENLKKEIESEPVLKINNEELYRVDYLEKNEAVLSRNKENYYDPEYSIDTGLSSERVVVASDFRKEAEQTKKELQDKYLKEGSGIPRYTKEELNYVRNSTNPPESDNLSEYIRMKNESIYGESELNADPEERYTYLDEEKEWGENTETSIAVAKKMDERFEAATKIIDEVYDNEIYNNDKWESLDEETKAYWDDYDDVKLDRKQSQHVAAQIIMDRFIDKLM